MQRDGTALPCVAQRLLETEGPSVSDELIADITAITYAGMHGVVYIHLAIDINPVDLSRHRHGKL